MLRLVCLLSLLLAACGGEPSTGAAVPDADDRAEVEAEFDAIAAALSEEMLRGDTTALAARFVRPGAFGDCHQVTPAAYGSEPTVGDLVEDGMPDERARYHEDMAGLAEHTFTRVLEVRPTVRANADHTVAFGGDGCEIVYTGEAWISLAREDAPPDLIRYRASLVRLGDEWWVHGLAEHDITCEDGSTDDACRQLRTGA